MIDPDVRAARSDDVAALRDLEVEARASVATVRGGARWLDEHPLIGADWQRAIDEREVVVAELLGSVVAGYLVLDVDEGVATVDQVYVSAPARELGFGDALLEAATHRARARGAHLIEGYALPGDRETKNLYERAGITARLITVSRPLTDPPSGRDASR